MKHPDPLPTELLWQDDGHVTDVVVDTLADGQEDAVPAEVKDHVQACDPCTQRLGEALLLTLEVGEALRKAKSVVEAPSVQAWPIPVPAVAAAVVLAAAGMSAALGEWITRMTELAKTIFALLPNLTRAALVWTHAGEAGTQVALLSLVSVAVLITSGMAIARAVPRQSPLRGGAR